jgi:hypothetical protein
MPWMCRKVEGRGPHPGDLPQLALELTGALAAGSIVIWLLRNAHRQGSARLSTCW